MTTERDEWVPVDQELPPAPGIDGVARIRRIGYREGAGAARKMKVAPDPAVDAALRDALDQFGTFGQQCARGAVTKGPQLLEAGKRASDRFAAALKPYGLKP